MRIFLKNALKFILPYVAILAVVAAWALYSEIKLYRSNIRIAPDIKYVVVGDSQSAMAIDPEYFPCLANHSIAGLSLDQALYKVRDLLEVNSDRDFTIILDVMPRRMLRGGWPLATADFESRYAILNFIHFFNSRRKIAEPVRLIRDRIVKDAFNSLTQRKFAKKRKRYRRNLGADSRQEASNDGFPILSKRLNRRRNLFQNHCQRRQAPVTWSKRTSVLLKKLSRLLHPRVKD